MLLNTGCLLYRGAAKIDFIVFCDLTVFSSG